MFGYHFPNRGEGKPIIAGPQREDPAHCCCAGGICQHRWSGVRHTNFSFASQVAAYHSVFGAMQLLQHGASVHHTSRVEGDTALHECVAKGHLKAADLLLQYGANPFMENAKGLTAVDLAINEGNTALLRVLESRARFVGLLNMKCSKFMGLGAEWKPRWCAIMPRYPFQRTSLGAHDRVARSLLVRQHQFWCSLTCPTASAESEGHCRCATRGWTNAPLAAKFGWTAQSRALLSAPRAPPCSSAPWCVPTRSAAFVLLL